MSGKENEDPDLKAFEAALGALRPRTDRLAPSFRAELAAAGPLSGHRPEVGRERARVRAAGNHAEFPCTNPAGHRFLCIHCGSEAARPRGALGWLAPAAFSALSAAVAVLVTVLVLRSGPQPPTPALVAERPPLAAVQSDRGPENRRTTEYSPRPADNAGGEETSYLSLRDQVLQQGVESWQFPASSAVLTAKAKDAAEASLSRQEQLNRLLEEQGLRGS
jgi:hypothetical protein